MRIEPEQEPVTKKMARTPFLRLVLPVAACLAFVRLASQAPMANTTTATPTTAKTTTAMATSSTVIPNTTQTPIDGHCLNGLLPCSQTVWGNIILMIFYGILLGVAAKLISDGAELLLDLGLPAPLIGGLILPLLGAVPDAAIIVVSGATGSKAEAQNSLQVGMGTLAGSTIMLLTLPWLGSLLLGRCDIGANGEAKDGTGMGKFSATRQGITLLPDVLNGLIMMFATSLPYLIIQGSVWHFGPTKPKTTSAPLTPHNVTAPPLVDPSYVRQSAMATMVFCIIGLFVYMGWQLYDSRSAERRAEKHRKEMLLRRVAARLYAMTSSRAFESRSSTSPDGGGDGGGGEKSPLVASEEKKSGLQKKYYSAWKVRGSAPKPDIQESEESEPKEKEKEDEKEEGEESKTIIAVKSFLQLGIGLAVVVIFSDPMCSVLTAMTDTKNHSYLPIKAFYVSFVVTPICSNASELVSSLIFAMKRRRVNISMTYSQLYGAATMNNTLCLAIFMALVYFRRLNWEYSAEVTVILLIQWAVGIIGYRKTYKVWYGFIVGALYIFSIALVAFLESSVVGWH